MEPRGRALQKVSSPYAGSTGQKKPWKLKQEPCMSRKLTLRRLKLRQIETQETDIQEIGTQGIATQEIATQEIETN